MNLYSHDQTCSDLPAGIDLTKSTGQVIQDGKVMVCQGLQCFDLNIDGSLQTKLSLTNSIEYASSFSHDNRIWFIGGLDSNHAGSSQLVTITLPAGHEEYELLLDREQLFTGVFKHCIADLNDVSVIVIGGLEQEESDCGRQEQTFVYNFDKGTFNPGPKIPKGRIQPMCGALMPLSDSLDDLDTTNIIVVTGGMMTSIETRSCETEPKPTVSTLMLINENWMIGPDLPKALCCGQGVGSIAGTSMFVIGGMDSNEQAVSDIYKLRCSKLVTTCMWQIVQSPLVHPRMNFLALMLPDAFDIDCQQSSTAIDGGSCFHTKTFLVNDGFCDDSANIEACSYDGTDCCLDNISDMFCKDCQCKGMQHPTNRGSYLTGVSLKSIKSSNPLLKDCAYHQWVNDSLCDMINNVEVRGLLLYYNLNT